MTKVIKLVAFAGSTRKDSYNKKVVKAAAEAARKAGAEVELVDLADYPMPFYDGDLEAAGAYPENASKLKKIFVESDGFLISSPEYNSSYSGVMKNAIDWVSRPETKDEPGLMAFKGKYAGLMAASPGALGGLRGLFALRELLQNIQVTVLPNMQAVGSVMNVLDDQGGIKDEKTAKNIEGVAKGLVETLQKLRA